MKSKTVDPYKVLGISHNATEQEIKRAYRKAALQNHPDRNVAVGTHDDPSDSEARMALINEAYAILKDPDRKKQFDHLYKYGAFRDHDMDNEGYSSDHRRGAYYSNPVRTSSPEQGGRVNFHSQHGMDPFSGIPAPVSRTNSHRQNGGGFSFAFSSFSSSRGRDGQGRTVHVRKTTQYQNGWKETWVETATVGADGSMIYDKKVQRERTGFRGLKDSLAKFISEHVPITPSSTYRGGSSRNETNRNNESSRSGTNSEGNANDVGGKKQNWFGQLKDTLTKCTGACGALISLDK